MLCAFVDAGPSELCEETAVPLKDDTLEFYAVIYNQKAITDIIQAVGNTKISIDPKEGARALEEFLSKGKPKLTCLLYTSPSPRD